MDVVEVYSLHQVEGFSGILLLEGLHNDSLELFLELFEDLRFLH